MGAPCRKMDPKVATAPKTQSSLTIKVEIKIKFNSRIEQSNLISLSLKALLNSSFSQRIVGCQGRVLFTL